MIWSAGDSSGIQESELETRTKAKVSQEFLFKDQITTYQNLALG